MSMNSTYIISQVFVVCAMIFLGLSYNEKDKKKIMILCVLCSLFYGGQYLLLGAYTGLAMNCVSIIRNIWFYINASHKKKNSFGVLMSLTLITIAFSIATYKDYTSLITMAATIIFTYSVWQDKTKVYRYLAVPVSILWIIYNAIYQSIFGVIAESVLLIVEIIGIIRIAKRKKVRKKS